MYMIKKLGHGEGEGYQGLWEETANGLLRGRIKGDSLTEESLEENQKRLQKKPHPLFSHEKSDENY